ncbi:MAG: hypothetical protein ACTSPQ_12195 [Candidatus Helarchaeota archaeon]
MGDNGRKAREFATHIYNNINNFEKNVGSIILEGRQLLYQQSMEIFKKEAFFDPTSHAFILFGDPTIKIG